MDNNSAPVITFDPHVMDVQRLTDLAEQRATALRQAAEAEAAMRDVSRRLFAGGSTVGDVATISGVNRLTVLGWSQR